MLPLGEALAPYNITADDLKKMKELIDAFDDVSELPRNMIVERSTHLQTLPQLVISIRKALYDMDGLVNFFDGTDFEAEYLNARKIVNPRSASTKADEEKPQA